MRGTRVRWLLVAALTVALGVALWNCGGGSSSKPKKPAIENINPVVGAFLGGDTVTIDTKNFKDDFTTTPPTSVYFGTQPATNVMGGLTGDIVLADTPQALAQGFVDVTVNAQNGQTATLPAAFEYQAPIQCSVISVAPASGDSTGGTAVSIFGTDFENDPTTTVTFGGNQATNVVWVGATQITCTTPAYPAGGLVEVIVTSTNRTCNRVDAFDYIVNPVCNIASVTPDNGNILGGDQVTLSGSGFEAFSTVRFGGVAGSNLQFVDPSLMRIDTPPDPLGQPAGGYTVDVEVSTPGGALCSRPAAYTYNAVPVNCTFGTVVPNNGDQSGGTQVTITGTNFGPVTPGFPVVLFGGLAATIDPATTGTQIICTTPAQPAPGVVDIHIDNSTGGSCDLLGGFTYNPTGGNPCTITGITPNQGDVSGGTTVLIDGTNFDAGTTVFFGGVQGTVTNVQPLQITVDTPPAASPGVVDVDVVPVGFAQCASLGGYTYTGCAITDVDPPVGPTSGGNSVAVNGSGFNATDAEVWFGGNAGTVVTRSDTQILVTVPGAAAEGLADVTVMSAIDSTSCTLIGGYRYAGCLITSVTPNTGGKVGGLLVQIVGTNFDPVGGAAVRFGVNLASNVNVMSATLIECNTPPSAVEGPVDVEVTNIVSGQVCPLPNGFSYNPASGGGCSVTQITPPNGPDVGGTPVTIFGSGFEGPPAQTPGVLFGPVTATNVSVVSPTEITCTTPQAQIPGAVNVTVVNESGADCTLASGYTYDPPVVCQEFCDPLNPAVLSPAMGPQAGGTNVTITAPVDSFCLNVTVEVWQQDALGNPFMTPVTPVTVTPTQITLIMPAAPAGIAGLATVIANQLTGICGPYPFTYN